MPTTSGPLEWNEENLSTALTELYREIESNETLRRQFLTDPFTVLSGLIAVPEEYRGGLFAREKGKKVMMLYPPAIGATREVLPTGTTQAEVQPDYDPICTVITIW